MLSILCCSATQQMDDTTKVLDDTKPEMSTILHGKLSKLHVLGVALDKIVQHVEVTSAMSNF